MGSCGDLQGGTRLGLGGTRHRQRGGRQERRGGNAPLRGPEVGRQTTGAQQTSKESGPAGSRIGVSKLLQQGRAPNGSAARHVCFHRPRSEGRPGLLGASSCDRPALSPLPLAARRIRIRRGSRAVPRRATRSHFDPAAPVVDTPASDKLSRAALPEQIRPVCWLSLSRKAARLRGFVQHLGPSEPVLE